MTRLFSLALAATLASGFATHAQEQKDPPKHFTNSIGMKFVWIKPGSFMMGSPKEEKGRKEAKGINPEAQHKVTLTKGFFMGVHLVTQEQWQEIMGNNPSLFKGEKNLPVENVSWNDCQEFIKKLREKDKKQPYRLPTEAEWEYACRAGTRTPFHFGETISTEQANYNGNRIYGKGEKGVYREKTTPVGRFPTNAWGLHDMHGNVYQWCQDWYGDYPQNDVVDPQGPEKGQIRVLRGGCWNQNPGLCRSAMRFWSVPGSGGGFGFRVCFFEDTPLPGTDQKRMAERQSPGFWSVPGSGGGFGFRVCFFEDTQSEESPKGNAEPKESEKKKEPDIKKDSPKAFTNSIGMKFVWIPPGSFMMGSPKEEKLRQFFEFQHKVTLTKGFYMAVYTVTQEQWKEIMGNDNNPSLFKGEKNLPVESVTWPACQEFLKKLRQKDKKPYRLPTEAEWEFCCRAGTKTPFHMGETISTDQANFDGTVPYANGKKGVFRNKTTPVGSFPANTWGLQDMHGNVYQWCQDWYGTYPKTDVLDPLGKTDIVDPQGPKTGTHRVLRGGLWNSQPQDCRSAARHNWVPDESRYQGVGFRVCFFVE